MFIIKRHMLINGLVLSLSFKKIEQILNGRMKSLCAIGIFLTIVACVLLVSVSIRKKYELHSSRLIKELGFWSLLIGIFIIVFSLMLPLLIGTGHGNDSTALDNQTSWISESDLRSFIFGNYESVSFEEAQASVAKKKAAYIRVFGNKVFFSNHLCKDDELSVLISEIPDNTTTYLIDDYAEDKVYNSVEKNLTAQSINPERLESKKNE